jgi:hypothetical protein
MIFAYKGVDIKGMSTLISIHKEVRITAIGDRFLRLGTDPQQRPFLGIWFMAPETSLSEESRGKKEK